MELSNNFKQKVVAALLEVRKNFDGSDIAFARQYCINNAVFSQLKNGKPVEGLLRDAQWIDIARRLDININERKWNVARTVVFEAISQDIMFCKEHSKAMILVDDCAIGKTFTAKQMAKHIKNCFYVDCSQYKTKQAFIRGLARTIGVDDKEKYLHVKNNIKYALKVFEKPVIILDEAGDLEYTAFLELKELWNATESYCGWYMMGAEGLRSKIERGINNKKVGFREIFSRYSDRFLKITPNDRQERYLFYQKLIHDVLSANLHDEKQVSELTKRCIALDSNGEIGGLRRAESLLLLTQKQNKL